MKVDKRGKVQQTELEGFQMRTVLAMVDEMVAMRLAVERNCLMFAALAKSMGIEAASLD